MNWYEYPIFSHFGEKDAQGDYWQPDANLAVPWGFTVTALLPGTITSVQHTNYGQVVVTEKLDAPINSLATHMFFEHLHSNSVQEGDHVNIGDQLGITNFAGEGASLGVGLYSGDVYGSGPAWDTLQQDLAPGGAMQLDPTPLIDAAKNGTTVPASGGTNSNILINIGEWIAINIFRTDAGIVSATSAVSTTPYLVIGIASLALPAIVAILLLVSFVSL